MSTPHNQATIGEIAKTVIMPGDPLRAKYIASNFLENVKQFNEVRNVLGFTGTYKGKEISVMASGMGIPSIGIYSYELFKFYGVENIIRVGSCGAYTDDLNVYDTILVNAAFSNSSYAYMQSGDEEKIQKPDACLNSALKEAASRLNIKVKEGMIESSDVFYYEDKQLEETLKRIKEMNIVGCEMESFGLFHNAKVLGKKAACLLTVSDHLLKKQETTAMERQTNLNNMIKIALEANI